MSNKKVNGFRVRTMRNINQRKKNTLHVELVHVSFAEIHIPILCTLLKHILIGK